MPRTEMRGDGRPAEARYSDEVAEADRQVARLVGALGDQAASTLIVVTSDHGEAFGEHGEISHSIFVYDTTLRVPLIVAGPGVRGRDTNQAARVGSSILPPPRRTCSASEPFNSDGLDLSAALAGTEPPRADALCRVVRAAVRLRMEPAEDQSARVNGSTSTRRSPSCFTSRRMTRETAIDTAPRRRACRGSCGAGSPVRWRRDRADGAKGSGSCGAAAGARLRRWRRGRQSDAGRIRKTSDSSRRVSRR